jgi:hypothetical protein
MLEDRRIIDEQIERPERFRRLRDQGGCFADIGEVGLQGGRPISLSPQFRHQLFGLTDGAVRVDRNGKASCSKVFGDCPAYSFSSPCYKGRAKSFVVQNLAF